MVRYMIGSSIYFFRKPYKFLRAREPASLFLLRIPAGLLASEISVLNPAFN
jgi:hypothetical protein